MRGTDVVGYRLGRIAIRLTVTSSFVLAFCAMGQAAHALSFQGLGDLAGGTVNSQATGISADGSTVVGGSFSANGRESFRWTQASGMVGLGGLSGGTLGGGAQAVSADGSVVVGNDTSAGGEAYRWTESGGMVGLGDLTNGGFQSTAFGVSADGSVVTGTSSVPGGGSSFRWTEIGGMVDLRPGIILDSAGAGVSADGSIIAGWARDGATIRPSRWTQAGGMVSLGLPPGALGGVASAVSADGNAIVGGNNMGSAGGGAFRWTESGGFVGLGDLAGTSNSALAVSADGSVIVGWEVGLGPVGAFIWDDANGMQSLQVLLTTLGVDLTGWELTKATGVSADGLTIAGWGTHNGVSEAFITTIPEPSTAILLSLGLVGLGASQRLGRFSTPRNTRSSYSASWRSMIG